MRNQTKQAGASTVRSYRIGTVLAGAALVSCVGGGDAPTGQTAQALSSATYDFILSNVAIDLPQASSRAGFNLDGAFSTSGGSDGCGIADHLSTETSDINWNGCSPPDPNCIGGVDNALPELVDAFDQGTAGPFRPQLQSSIQNGHQFWIVRITDVDSLSNDEWVRVFLYRGFATTSDCGKAFTSGAKYYVDNASLAVSGDLSQPLWELDGGIYNGNLYVSQATSFTSSVNAKISMNVALSASSTLNMTLYQGSMYIPNVQNVTGGNAVTGMFGGWVATSAFGNALYAALGAFKSAIFALMPHLSDLPSVSTGACDTGAQPAVGGISLGATVTLVPIYISGTADSAGSGTCGTSW